jgi:hypothetical protein
MKACASIFLVVVFLTSFSAFAQIQDEIELTRSIIQTQRQAIVANAMQLTDEQSKAFWPLYREYRAELGKLGDRWVNMITEYAANYENLTDEKADWIISEHFAIEKAKLKIDEKYLKKFQGVLPTKLVARFYQVENKLDAVVDYDIAQQVPLVK